MKERILLVREIMYELLHGGTCAICARRRVLMKKESKQHTENPSIPEKSSSSSGRKVYPANRKLIAVDWRVPLGAVDAIQSFLVEHPGTYYMSGNRQSLYLLTREHGLLFLVNDFRGLTNDQVAEYIRGVLEFLYS
jgi:hypothetical protein